MFRSSSEGERLDHTWFIALSPSTVIISHITSILIFVCLFLSCTRQGCGSNVLTYTLRVGGARCPFRMVAIPLVQDPDIPPLGFLLKEFLLPPPPAAGLSWACLLSARSGLAGRPLLFSCSFSLFFLPPPCWESR